MVAHLVPVEMRKHLTAAGDAKHAFDTLEEAQAFAATLKSSKRRPYRGYPCTLCPKFHVGRRRAR